MTSINRSFADSVESAAPCGSGHAATAAKHLRGEQTSISAIAWKFFVGLRWQYFPMLLSDYGIAILRRKYDAIATDMAYENRASGKLGPIGKWVDRQVLDMPLHHALRGRLTIVANALETEIRFQREKDIHGPVRVLSAPCGVVRDILTASASIKSSDPELIEAVKFSGLDLDVTGEVIPLATDRTNRAELAMSFYREDLFKPECMLRDVQRHGRFQVVNCIGLTPWLAHEEVESLLNFVREQLLRPGGSIIIDNFARHDQSHVGDDLGIHTEYHAPDTFEAAIANAGLKLDRIATTDNGINTVYVARSLGYASIDPSESGRVAA